MNDERSDFKEQLEDDSETKSNIKINQKKRFKGLNTQDTDQIVKETPPLREQYVYKDKQLEQYIQQRMVEEKIKIQNIGQRHGLIVTPSVNMNEIEKKHPQEHDFLYKMPAYLDVDKTANDREIIDKPIQWTAGMMEVPAATSTHTPSPGRKVISRASRGGFQGQNGASSITRIGKGEYQNMIKAMNFNHLDKKGDKKV